jgi:hypothetical protein
MLLAMHKRLFVSVVLVSLAAATAQARIPQPAQNLIAAVNGNTVTLTWQPPATGPAPLGYILEASLSPGGPVIAAFAVASTSMIVTSVPSGVFYVRVRSVDAEGVGLASNEAIVAVPGGGSTCGTAPNAPGGLARTVVGDLVTLNWSASVSGCPATGYVIQAGSAPGASNLAVLNVGPATSLSVVAPPGTYYVRVVATNASGGSVPSNEVVVLVPQP